jgi:hypothetical protein
MGRKGPPRTVLTRVKFEDGFTAVTSRNAIRRRKMEESK